MSHVLSMQEYYDFINFLQVHQLQMFASSSSENKSFKYHGVYEL